MRQRNYQRPVVSPSPHGLTHAFSRHAMQMISLRIGSNGKNELELRCRREQPVMPGADAFRPRWLVGAKPVITGETKAHRNDGDTALVVKNIWADGEPGTQPLARRVAVWNAGFVNA